MWKKVQTQPATYIPTAYPKSASRSKSVGDWHVDERDGKKFFVPRSINGPYSSAILAAKAKKNVNWQFSKGKDWYRSVHHE